MSYRQARRLYLIATVPLPPDVLTVDFCKKAKWLSGRKQIGKKVILRRNGHTRKQDTYPYVVPNNPRTPLQQNNRQKFQAAMVAWTALPPDQKAIYEQRATGRDLTGKNLYVRAYMLDEL